MAAVSSAIGARPICPWRVLRAELHVLRAPGAQRAVVVTRGAAIGAWVVRWLVPKRGQRGKDGPVQSNWSKSPGVESSKSKLSRVLRLAIDASAAEAALDPENADLESFAQQMRRVLELKRPQRHDQIHDHELAPLIQKKWWTQLGKLVKAHEEYQKPLPTNAWISLRLDGCCWGTLMARLKASGILDYGFRSEIAETMIASCRAVMCEFGAVVGYTHSDEMSILVPPLTELPSGSSCRPEGGGHVSWWVSIAASVATATCNRMLAALAAQKLGGPSREVLVLCVWIVSDSP
ncbi:2-Mannosidase [Durusdinium trenchii]|uniref:2-Mannosidase n=1 Tax=Durusdinium trenchii TaxID=1381693 RepID=A0ABP0ML81_9DINO